MILSRCPNGPKFDPSPASRRFRKPAFAHETKAANKSRFLVAERPFCRRLSPLSRCTARDRTCRYRPKSALGGHFRLGDPLASHSVDDAAELLDLLAEPREFFLADAVMLRVARLHIGLLELLEHHALLAVVLGPDIHQAPVDEVGL